MSLQGHLASTEIYSSNKSTPPPSGPPKHPKISGPETPEELFAKAAESAMSQIQKDRNRVSGRLRPLLEYLNKHLFHPDLNVNQLKRGCGIQDNSIVLRFHAEVGHTPKAYITGLRLETAARLLRDTRLKIWQIGDLVGYSSLGVFSKAFHRWSGIRPMAYRKASHQRQKARQVEPVDVFDNDLLQRALKGRLDANEALQLIHRLCTLYQFEEEEFIPEER